MTIIEWLKQLIFPLSYEDFGLVPWRRTDQWRADQGLGEREANLLLKAQKPVGWEHCILVFPKKTQGNKVLCLLCNAGRWRQGFVSPDNEFFRKDGWVVLRGDGWNFYKK